MLFESGFEWFVFNVFVFPESGKLYCSGQNSDFQVGDGAKLNRKAFKLVEALSDEIVVDVACGASFTLAITGL